MPRYLVDATVTITVEQVPLTLADHITEEAELHDALVQKLGEQLILLDIKGGRTGDDGCVTSLECDDIVNWSQE